MGAEGDLVGQAHVDIHVNSAPGEAELAAFKAKVDRDFAELDRKKAEAKITADKRPLERAIAETEAELAALNREKVDIEIGVDKDGDAEKRLTDIDKKMKDLAATKRKLASEKGIFERDAASLKDLNAQRALSEKRQAAMARAYSDEQRMIKRVANERAHSLREVQRAGQVEARARAQNAKYDAERIDSSIKVRAELAKLSEQYEKLRGRQLGLEKSSRRVFSSRSIATAEKEARQLERVASEADLVRHKIEKLGGSVHDLDPQIQRNHTLWGRWLSRLGDTSIRIGPITTSLKGLGLGLGLLGPLLFQLGGGLTSLVGTIGEGLVGAATIGAGALGGLALSAAGVGFIIKPMIGEFKEVKSASEAVHKAQLKYGKGSDEVRTAQEKLNHELHGVSPIAREAFQSYGGLADRWKSLTKAARPAVFNAFGESLKTAQSLLPAFASESVKTTQVASKAWSGWMKSLRSDEAKGILKGIMSDFRASIPGLADGLGSLLAMLGRLSAAGAHFLPGLSNGFAEWADNLEHAVGGGQALQQDVGGLVDQMRDLGHLSQDTGSLLVHIFDASADSGQGLVNSLDDVIQRWDKWTQTAEGKRGLNDFFGDSKSATEDFMSSLSHLTNLLFQFSRATAPVADGLLKIATGIGDLVSAASGIVGVKTAFQGLGIALAGLWVTGKVMAFAGGIQTVTRALYGMAAGEAAVAAAQSSGLGSILLGRGKKSTTVASAGDNAARSAKQLALFGTSAGAAEAAAGGLTRGAGLLALALTPQVLIPAAVVAGLVTLAVVLDDAGRSVEDMQEDFRRAGHEMNSALDSSAGHIDGFITAQNRNAKTADAVAAAQARVIKLQNAGAPPRKVVSAIEELTAAEDARARAVRHTGAVNKEQITDQRQLLRGTKDRVKSAKELVDSLKEQVSDEKTLEEQNAMDADPATVKDLAAAKRELARASREAGEAYNEEAAALIPYERHQKGLQQITKNTATALRELSTTIGAAGVKKIGNFVDPKDVARATNLTTQLAKLGRGGQAKNIAVKSSGADETISKLQRLRQQSLRVEGKVIKLKATTNDSAAQKSLQRLSARAQRLAGTQTILRILANSSNAEEAIRKVRAKLKAIAQEKYEARINAIDNSKGKSDAAKRRLREAAGGNYTAQIKAVDNASPKAIKAKAKAEAFKQGKYDANITANASQAMSEIERVKSGLAAINGTTARATVYVGVSGPGAGKLGNFAGGPAAYIQTIPFAAGGLNNRELQRANEKAVRKQAGPSQRINKPTMLVGEQAPQHHEYVIATNPAYRDANERYLDQAAGDLGYEVVPAYKKGKGKKSKNKAGGAGQKTGPGPHPPKLNKRTHRYLKATKLNYGEWLQRFNATEQNADVEEGHYGAELNHEEREIAAGRMENWDYGLLRGFKENIREDNRKLLNPIIPRMEKKIVDQQSAAEKTLKGTRVRLSQVGGTIGKLENEYDKMEKNSSESTKDFNTKKRRKKHQIDEWQKQQKELRKARKNEEALIKEAKKELAKIRGETPGIKDALYEAEGDVQYITDVEGGIVEAPYAETGGGKDAPTIGEQTASLSEAREQLYQQFASNITGQTAPGAAPGASGAGGGSAAGGPMASSFGGTGRSGGAPGYIPGAPGYDIGRSGGTPNYFPGSASSSPRGAMPGSTSWPGGRTIKVVNNFAAPPPDAHTWAKSQEFELGALS